MNNAKEAAELSVQDKEAARMVDVLRGVYDPPLCRGISVANIQRHPLSYYYEAMEHLGLKTLQDIPNSVLEALDEGTPGNFKNTILDLQFRSDYAGVLGPFGRNKTFGFNRYEYEKGQLPAANTPFLAAPGFVRQFAQDEGLKSIFEKWVGVGAECAGVAPARKNLLRQYHDILVEKNDPAYPASQVRKDYFDAAVHGAKLKMPTWEDDMDVMIARRFSFLPQPAKD